MQVIKEEFSSSGLGVRVCNSLSDLDSGKALERWLRGCLARDGVVTVEPWLEILVEFSAEYVLSIQAHQSATTTDLKVKMAPPPLRCCAGAQQVDRRSLEWSVNAAD